VLGVWNDGFSNGLLCLLMKNLLGLFASLLIIDPPDVKAWIRGGEAPVFMGPVGRIGLNRQRRDDA